MRRIVLLAVGLAFFAALPMIALSQNQLISGVVTDAAGHPVASASVIAQGTMKGTATDVDGKFKLSVPAKTSIIVSALGFTSKVINAADISDGLQVRLSEDITHLDEIVVTGLATTIKRRNAANAVAVISSRELDGVAPAQTLDGALEGKIPGAYINANSGSPGGGVSVKLRGVTSVYGITQPLYVLDGVFLDNTATSAGLNAITGAAAGGSPTSTQDNASSRIADINPADIENIEILKGASAAAVYGSRAAAGVIVITTKKGKEGKTRVTASQDLGFIKVRKLLGVRQFNAERAASLSSDSATSAALAQEFTTAQSQGHIYDYEKEVYGNTGFARNTLVSVSGGSAKTTVYFSASQKDEGGIVKNTGYRNSSLRLNVNHQLTDNIKLGITTAYINSSADRGLQGNDNAGVSLGIALSSTPSFAQLHPDAQGNFPNNPFASSNPLQTLALMTNNESVNRFVTGVNLDALLQQSNHSTTRFVAVGGFDFYNLQTTALFPAQLQFESVNKGTSIQGNTSNINTNYIASLVNTWKVSDDLTFTSSAGITGENGSYYNLLNVATQLISGQSNVDQAGALNATELRTKFQNNGIFVQEEANINDALTLTAGVRFDNSSNNGDFNKNYVYPKGGVSWNLTKSGVIPDGFFTNVKVRAAYGPGQQRSSLWQ